MPLSNVALQICLETNLFLKYSILYDSSDEDCGFDSSESKQEANYAVKKTHKHRVQYVDSPKSSTEAKKTASKRKLQNESSAESSTKPRKLFVSEAGLPRKFERRERGEFVLLYENYRRDPQKFFEYTRMSVETFDYLLEHVKDECKSSKAISATEQLFLTLRYLSARAALSALSAAYCLGRSTVAGCVYRTARALLRLAPAHLPPPTAPAFRDIAARYYDKFHFPNCIGSVGERYFRINRPSTKADTSRRRRTYIVLQAIVDADYKFIAIDVVQKTEEYAVFSGSKMTDALAKGQFNVPLDQNAPNSDTVLPFVLIGSEAFPLRTYLMRPYTKEVDDETKTFNERLNGARTAEGALNVLTSKWGYLSKSLEVVESNAALLVRAAALLHNVVRARDADADADFRAALPAPTRHHEKRCKNYNHSSVQASAARKKFKDYFASHPI